MTQNDGIVRPLDGFALFLCGIVLYKVFFAVCYLLYFKIRLSLYNDLKINEIDMKKDIKALTNGNVADSDMDYDDLEAELAEQEEVEEDNDDQLLQTCLV